MKNQYVGDIGDYGKYSLLRFLSLQGIRIGINWYLTENDSSTDGNHTDYLKNASKRALDPDIYDALKEITERYEQSNRTVQMIPKAELIPNALFFDKKLPLGQMNPMVRAWRRRLWFRHSRAILENTDMVFADPDNGVTYKKTARNKGCEKYVLPEELAQYYYAGKDVVFYCHKGRRIRAEWEQTKGQIRDYICDAALFVLTFHRGTQRSYIFVVHPERAEKYTTLLTKFLLSTEWGKTKAFTREDVIERPTQPLICAKSKPY